VANSVARLADRQGRRVVVVDNHLSGNPVLSVLDLSERGPSPEAWGLVYEIREIVVRAIEEHSPADWSFVFTNVLTVGGDSDVDAVDRLRRLATARRSRYVPVVLTCDVDELARRAVAAGRAEQHKVTDAELIRAYVAARQLHHPDDATVLDVTSVPADDTAAAVLRVAALA
jgi:hypothetical protein